MPGTVLIAKDTAIGPILVEPIFQLEEIGITIKLTEEEGNNRNEEISSGLLWAWIRYALCLKIIHLSLFYCHVHQDIFWWLVWLPDSSYPDKEVTRERVGILVKRKHFPTGNWIDQFSVNLAPPWQFDHFPGSIKSGSWYYKAKTRPCIVETPSR